MLRFIHCADLHIGTSFKGVANTFGANSSYCNDLFSAPERAFNFIIDSAINQKVDFVLFAGDIMDSVNVSWRSISVFSQGLEKLKNAGIPSFVIAGNHDAMPNNALSAACKSATLFPAGEIVYHEIPDKAIIGGISFSNANAKVNLAKQFKRQDSDLFQIALFHGNIGGQENYDNYSPASISDLTATGMDYWALGHIHEKNILSVANPVILYSGSPLSRNVNEKSVKGFYLIEVDDFKNVKTNFIPCGILGFFREEINLNEIDSIEKLKEKCSAAANSIVQRQQLEKYFIEIIFCGKTELDSELRLQNEEELISMLSLDLPSNCIIISIIIKTEKNIDREEFRNSNIFASDLHETFAAEKSENHPSLNREIAALKRACGKLLDTDTISAENIAEDAESEIINMLMEDMI